MSVLISLGVLIQHLVLCLLVAQPQPAQRAEVSLKSSQLGTGGGARLANGATASLPHYGPQGQQEVTHQQLHPLG